MSDITTNQEKPDKRLAVRKIWPATQKKCDWIVEVPVGTTLEDLRKPIFWTNVAGDNFRGDYNMVDVFWEDMSQYARLWVTHYDNSFAATVLVVTALAEQDEAAAAVEDKISADGYTVKFSGKVTKWRIIRDTDQAVILENFATKEEAQAYIKDMKKRGA